MDASLIDQLKITAIQALVSDDVLMERLVLKGGNALDLIHKIAERGSFDLDFSLEDSFDDDQLGVLEQGISKRLVRAFDAIGYRAFDVTLRKRPENIDESLDSIWGGYKLEFKLMPLQRYEELKSDIERLRREAIPIGHRRSTKLRIDISRFEYVSPSEYRDVGGYRARVYTPTLIAVEKLRAICQQMDEYREVVGSLKASPRARDFFDIYTIVNTCHVDLTSAENKTLVKAVFAAKRVPVHYLMFVRRYKEFHAVDFDLVRDIVKPDVKLRDFGFYFDFVADICDRLQA